jgi:phosphosulfolactate synthase (CoM biosynthesis protein A)
MKWEYKTVATEKYLNTMIEIGCNEWELVAASDDLIHFKRPKKERNYSDARQSAFDVITELSKREDELSKLAANFMRNTIGIANTIENQGWNFAAGHDLIEDILHPCFTDKGEEQK